ncbi:MAG: hypothetical protein AAF602_08490 [Myxococcota bacterium]
MSAHRLHQRALNYNRDDGLPGHPSRGLKLLLVGAPRTADVETARFALDPGADPERVRGIATPEVLALLPDPPT